MMTSFNLVANGSSVSVSFRSSTFPNGLGGQTSCNTPPPQFVGSEANFMVFLNSIPGRRRTRRPLAIHRPAWDAGKNSIFAPFEAKNVCVLQRLKSANKCK